ncbi:hypothetical protein [Aeoliella sp. SH292]
MDLCHLEVVNDFGWLVDQTARLVSRGATYATLIGSLANAD